jgi:hypothetical protein
LALSTLNKAATDSKSGNLQRAAPPTKFVSSGPPLQKTPNSLFSNSAHEVTPAKKIREEDLDELFGDNYSLFDDDMTQIPSGKKPPAGVRTPDGNQIPSGNQSPSGNRGYVGNQTPKFSAEPKQNIFSHQTQNSPNFQTQNSPTQQTLRKKFTENLQKRKGFPNLIVFPPEEATSALGNLLSRKFDLIPCKVFPSKKD